MIVPSLKDVVFVLAANGTIYLFDLGSQLVQYQFQCSLPALEDPRLHLFMDQRENFICCALGHGRIIVWDITPKMQTQFAHRP